MYDPNKVFDGIKAKVAESMSSVFPIVGGGRIISAEKVWVDDNKDAYDLTSQKTARLKGRSWAVPIKAALVMRDEKSNRVIDKKTVHLADLPKITPRLGMIYEGSEYQATNLLLLRPGVYTRERADGSLVSEFHTRGKPFKLRLDPNTKKFSVDIGGANPDLYPILKSFGVDDATLEKNWGKEILEVNKGGDVKSVDRMYRAFTGKKPDSRAEAIDYVLTRLRNTVLDPEVTGMTLSKPYEAITPETLTDATSALLGLSRGARKSDNRDSLVYKKIAAAEDHFANKVTASARDIKFKVLNNIRRFDDLQRVMPPSAFQRPINDVFQRSSVVELGDQLNPIGMVSSHTRATVLGEGGLKTEHEATPEMRMVDPSHIGFLDPLHTPENSKVGLALHLAEGAAKSGEVLTVPVWNIKEDKLEKKSLQDLRGAKIILPDQVKLSKDGVAFTSKKVRVYDVVDGVQDKEIPVRLADYALVAPQQMFSAATNLLPFMQNNSPLRATIASRQLQQALPLVNREPPLVQTGSLGVSNEQRWGRFNAHMAKVPGVVKKVGDNEIVIAGDDGKNHKVPVYRNFPLNDPKSFLDSEPRVKKGDRVKIGDVLSDTNFTSNGVLSVGTQLRTAYIPYKGLNYEDAVVVSESGAKKLTSVELQKKAVALDAGDLISKRLFQTYFNTALPKDSAEKLDDDGVIRVGELVKPGDTLIAALRKGKPTTENRMLKRLHKSLVRPYDNISVTWTDDRPGIVTDVVRSGKNIKVFVKSEKPAEVGDKLTNRHGAKGVISTIVPDSEMPATADGRHAELLLNPVGVPGRINLGQVFETATAKLAEKTGKPIIMESFDGTPDVIASLQDELKKNGITDKEELFDPTSGKKLGNVLIGPQYVLKLKHEVEKKRSARAGGVGFQYDRDRVPKGGGPEGAKSLGNLGLYSVLSRGASANIREMATTKTDMSQSDEVWTAIQSGLTPPAPRPTFAFNKFTSYIKALGIDVKKNGNVLTLAPMTDKQILAETAGEIKDPGKVVRALDPTKPEKGGLFDPDVTGGLDGNKWSRIRVPEPIPNPIFESGIRKLLSLSANDYNDLVVGRRGITAKGELVDASDAKYVGGIAFKKLLDGIDVSSEITAIESKLPTLKKTELSDTYKRLRYLRALKEHNLKPAEAYLTNYIPVLPPSFRPLRTDASGNIVRDDINDMYRGIGQLAQQLGQLGPKLEDTDSTKQKLREDLYDGMKALAGVGTYPLKPWRGIMDIIEGKKPTESGRKGQPKEGFFQSKLLGARQDLTLYSTITPDPTLGLDEVGIPRKLAMTTYKPWVVSEIRSMTGLSPLKAQQLIKEGDPIADRALERAVENRPIWLKRDPALHKYNVQSYKPKLVPGNIIKLHPLSTGGFNADHDGDSMSAFVPISVDAVKEAYQGMPSNNLFNPATGKIMYTPTQEMQTGLFLMSRLGDKKAKKFSTVQEAEAAISSGGINITDVVTIEGKKTTVGRTRIANTLPDDLKKAVLDSTRPLDKGLQRKLFEEVGHRYKDDYGTIANKLKDLGSDYAYSTGMSLGLEDFVPERKLRDSVLAKAEASMAGASLKTKIKAYDKATATMMTSLAQKKDKNPDTLWLMAAAGVKPGPEQYRQLILAPMLIKNPDGSIIPTPVKKSYAEGLTLADYWASVSGGRQGIIEKVQSVREPGALTKEMVNSTLDEVVMSDDCGTRDGIPLNVDDSLNGRILAQPWTAGRTTIAAGTVLDQDLIDRMRANRVKESAMVRSPLRCQHGIGVCSKCYGVTGDGELPTIGQNMGVMASQTLGERSTQLALKAFHGGGVVPVGKTEPSGLKDQFARVKQLLEMPQNVPGSAPLVSIEEKEGRVEAIRKDPAGGYEVIVSGVRHYVPESQGTPVVAYKGKVKPVTVGMTVKRGDPLSAGLINPHELLPLTGMDKVQRYLSDELYNLYRGEGVDRRAVETVVRSLTNVAKVDDPGDVPGFTRGDTVPLSVASTLNRGLKQGKQMAVEPLLRGVNIMPLEKTEDWMARMNHNRLRDTLVEAAQQGWSSSIHGVHPIPAAVYGAEFGVGKFY